MTIPDSIEDPTFGVKMRAKAYLPPRDYCKGKVKYDKKSALTAKNSRYKRDHVELRVYHCPECNGWHLTSKI